MDDSNKDILIIRAKTPMPQAQLEYLRNDIARQRNSSIIVLPCFCEALVVPDDTEIKFETGFKTF